tara:strand:+ start:438 stop:665 length:228 start_codon:yes stop_codon:yes gene_type:complete
MFMPLKRMLEKMMDCRFWKEVEETKSRTCMYTSKREMKRKRKKKKILMSLPREKLMKETNTREQEKRREKRKSQQ